jgi:hypothetical protein
MPRDRRLTHTLPRPDDRDRRQRKRLQHRGIEPKVGPDVRHSSSEHATREREPVDRAEHRLVGEVDDDVRGHRVERVDERHAVVLAAAQLLGAPDEQRPDEVVRKRGERVAHDRRVVLAVDHRESTHHAGRTSRSMRAVYFSYSRVSVENWMIFSCPWYG